MVIVVFFLLSGILSTEVYADSLASVCSNVSNLPGWEKRNINQEDPITKTDCYQQCMQEQGHNEAICTYFCYEEKFENAIRNYTFRDLVEQIEKSNIDEKEKEGILEDIQHLVLRLLRVLLKINFDGVSDDQNLIKIDPSVRYQVINGWEVHSQSGELSEVSGGANLAFDSYKDELFDSAVNEFGVNRVRLEVTPEIEMKRDFFAEFLNGTISLRMYRGTSDHDENDNNDPQVINWRGFTFSSLDYKIEKVVNPLRKRLETNGERLYVNLVTVDVGHNGTHFKDPEEYAEYIEAIFLHLKQKYGWVPDQVEVSLEPTVFETFSGEELGKVLVAAAKRLEVRGFNPDFSAPSETSLCSARDLFTEMITVPDVKKYLKEFSFHGYNCQEILPDLVNLSDKHGIPLAMLEWWDVENNYKVLHTGLKVAKYRAWQQAALAFFASDTYPGSILNLFTIDDVNKSSIKLMKIKPNEPGKYFRHYYKWVRKDATRIGATSNNNNFDPIAFINSDGKHTVIVKASARGNFTISGLPQGRYNLVYTVGDGVTAPIDTNWNNQSIMNISLGQDLKANITGEGVVTIYQKT